MPEKVSPAFFCGEAVPMRLDLNFKLHFNMTQKRTINVKFLLWVLGLVLVFGIGIHFLHAWQVRRNAGAILQQAEKALETGQLGQAASYFNYFLAFEPEDLEARVKYAITLDRLATSSAGQVRAYLALDDVLRRDPSRHEIRYRLIHCLAAMQRFEEAIKNIDLLWPHWPNQGELEHKRGWCYEANGEYARAAASFSRAVKMAPGQIESYLLLAEILKERFFQPEEAARVMDSLVQANEQNTQAFLARARFRRQQGADDEAGKDIHRALQLRPQDAEVLLAAADWSLARADFTQARSHVEKGLQLHPKNPGFFKGLAALEMRQGRPAEALANLKQAVEILPEAADLHVLLAELLIEEGRLAEAERTISRLRQGGLVPGLSDYLQARLAVRKGEWLAASGLLERAQAELGPASEWQGRIQVLLGLCYEQVGDAEQQITAFQKALVLEPGWTLARFGLGKAYLAAGRIDQALGELEQVSQAQDATAEVWVPLARALIVRNLRVPEKNRSWSGAEWALSRAAEEIPESVDIPILHAEILMARNEPAQAREVLEKARLEKPQSPAFWCALADLALRQKQFDRSREILDQAEKHLGDRVELRLARCRLLGVQGGPEARQDLAELSRNLGAWPAESRTRLRRELAETWRRLGDSAAAEKLWKQLAQDQPRDLASRFQLFESALHMGRLEQAQSWLEDLRKVEGKQGHLWRYGRAVLLVQESAGDPKKLAEARQLLAEVSRLQPRWSRLYVLEAQIAEKESKWDRAIDQYLLALEQGERRSHLLFRLVRLLFERRRFLEAEHALAKVEEQWSLSGELARLGAEIALANGNLGRTRNLAEMAAPAHSRDYRDHLWLARILHRVGDDAQAEQVLQRALKLAGHTPDTWIALTDHLARTGQHSRAEAILAQARKQLPQDRIDFTLARSYEVLGQNDRAEEFFLKALSARPKDFILLVHLADFFQRSDQPNKAIPYFQKMFDPSCGTPGEYLARARRDLALIIAQAGDPENGLKLLEPNIQTYGESLADVRARFLVQGWQAANPWQRRQAVRQFEETLHVRPASNEEQFWFARLQEKFGNVNRARELVFELLTADPENPQWLAFLARSFLHQGEAGEAQIYLTRLERIQPASPRTLTLKKALGNPGDN